MRLIVTDLDGTLIDHHTYSADPAREALDALAAAAVPVVPCSSKTRAEMHRLAGTLRLPPAPLIAENGSVVWLPREWPYVPDAAVAAGDGDGWLLVLGSPGKQLRPLLPKMASMVGRRLRPISGMSIDEVVARTGLQPDAAALARAREFTEPFVSDPDDVPLEDLQDAARRLDARVTRGGRFFHLLGATDKGRAVRIVRASCPQGHRALGLGDAPNDLALLQACDDAVIVPQPGRGIHPALAAALPQARHAPEPGPAGWNAAVLAWLRHASD